MKHKSCVIIGAGESPRALALPEDALLIAADGGWRYLRKKGIVPHITVGDFDSLGFVPEGAWVHPKEKDDTDTMLAVKLGLEQGCEHFFIYGGLGGRSDHSFANYCTLSYLARRGCLACLVGREESVVALGQGNTLCFPSFQGTVSVFAFGDKARVKLEGLRYEFEGELTSDFPLGVSNEFTQTSARVTVTEGVILLFLRAEPEALVQLLEENRGTNEV